MTCSSASNGPAYGSDSNTSRGAPPNLPEGNAAAQPPRVDEPAAGRVHDPDAVAHAREGVLPEEPLCLRVQREVERDQVGCGIDVLRSRGGLDPQLAGALTG